MTGDDLRCSVVVPVFNSEATLPELHRRLTVVMSDVAGRDGYEIIFVDDSGGGAAWSTLVDLSSHDGHVRAIQLMRNLGQALATIAGFEAARGSRVVTIDDDLQHPPEAIPALMSRLDEDPQCDVVVGVAAEVLQPLYRRAGSRAVNRMNTVLLGKPPDLRFTGFRVMRSDVAKALVPIRLPSPALGPLILRVTPRIANVEVEHGARAHGSSGYTLGKLLRQTMGNAIAFSMLPLQVLAAVGLVGIVFSFAFAAFLVGRFVLHGTGVPGFTALALLLSGLTGFSFFAYRIIGEYLIRILNSNATTPPYLVRSEIGAHRTDGVDGHAAGPASTEMSVDVAPK